MSRLSVIAAASRHRGQPRLRLPHWFHNSQLPSPAPAISTCHSVTDKMH